MGGLSSTVCVLHIKPFFLLVDIHHALYPCRFFLMERYKLCGHKTTIQKTILCNHVHGNLRAVMEGGGDFWQQVAFCTDLAVLTDLFSWPRSSRWSRRGSRMPPCTPSCQSLPLRLATCYLRYILVQRYGRTVYCCTGTREYYSIISSRVSGRLQQYCLNSTPTCSVAMLVF